MRHADTTQLPPTTLPAVPTAARTILPLSPSLKVKNHHLQRQAIVYVRQSTIQQIANNRESTQRQYALDQRAIQLGWSPQSVTTINDDQGLSGQTAEGRHGFQSMLAQIALNRVGIVLGLEMSRLARSNKDWHQLLEVCGIFGTLLADQDGVYDPTDHNDRLLLGLKGTISEAASPSTHNPGADQ
jgi:DNA invertase Pin-like site-specific DNA recombinase